MISAFFWFILKKLVAVYKLRVLEHFASWEVFGLEGIRAFRFLAHILGLEALRYFGLKNKTKKTDKIHKDFELFEVFMCQTVRIFPQNIYYS